MDAVNYAAWVLKPTSNEAESTGQPPLAIAMSVDGGDAPTDDNNTVTDSADGATGRQNNDAFSTTLTEQSTEKNGEAAPLLFIDEEEEDGDGENSKDAVGKNDNRDEPSMVAAGDGQPQSKPEVINIPLIDYLCALNACSLKELQLLLYNVKARKHMIAYLQQHCALRTAHLRPAERNQWLQCHDLSTQSVNHTYACNGYLELTVRQYFFAKHGLKLKHPYLPCLIEFGGGSHASYYPLEVINVVMEHTRMLLPPSTLTTCPASSSAANNEATQKRTRRSPLHSISGAVFEVPPQFSLLYRSKNNTDKSAVEETEQQQQKMSPTSSTANGKTEKTVANAAVEMTLSQQKRAGMHCCCCCCDCHQRSPGNKQRI